MRGERTEIYAVKEVAEILGVGLNTAYEAARRGGFPAIKVGARILIPKKRFDRWLEEDSKPTD
ncbi:MAG: helix-turn-helix domain-containing protein [Gammaproteobacteria bacterium]|nr:helix-turn-helix domain-containing protein [Gammaproteobacteria bacterium]